MLVPAGVSFSGILLADPAAPTLPPSPTVLRCSGTLDTDRSSCSAVLVKPNPSGSSDIWAVTSSSPASQKLPTKPHYCFPSTQAKEAGNGWDSPHLRPSSWWPFPSSPLCFPFLEQRDMGLPQPPLLPPLHLPRLSLFIYRGGSALAYGMIRPPVSRAP